MKPPIIENRVVKI